jgi:hypothetical protein
MCLAYRLVSTEVPLSLSSCASQALTTARVWGSYVSALATVSEGQSTGRDAHEP